MRGRAEGAGGKGFVLEFDWNGGPYTIFCGGGRGQMKLCHAADPIENRTTLHDT